MKQSAEGRTNQIVEGNRRAVAFAKSSSREDFPLRVRGAQVAMEAALHPVDYTNVPTDDLLAMAQLHLDAIGFTALKPNSRATALAALMGIRMGK